MNNKKWTTENKISVFAGLFQGKRDVYGTYNPKNGKHWQVKQKVTKKTIYEHLKGIRSYGFYPLIGDRTRVGIVDFDIANSELPLQFINRAKHYELNTYLERSKSKGYHVWMFFLKNGVPAKKARLIMNYILQEIDSSPIEIFPKQDCLETNGSYGNFINAPLFGKFVQHRKTVFIRPDSSLEPFPDQWEFLESVKRIEEKTIDSLIEINNLNSTSPVHNNHESQSPKTSVNRFGLPPCIRTILHQGVTFDQRVACFRVAVHLKRIGLPFESSVALLLDWRIKNRPIENKQVITPQEIEEQTQWAFKKNYTGFGCQEPIIRSYCDPQCPVKLHNRY